MLFWSNGAYGCPDFIQRDALTRTESPEETSCGFKCFSQFRLNEEQMLVYQVFALLGASTIYQHQHMQLVHNLAHLCLGLTRRGILAEIPPQFLLHRADQGCSAIHYSESLVIESQLMEEKNILGKYKRIESVSDEWKIIEFKLQLSLGRSSVVIKNLHAIENTHLNSAFSNYAKGSIVLESFYPAQKLGQNNKLVKVCQKGYQFGDTGMIFHIGFSQIRDTKKEMTCIMNKISVGKSYCYSAAKFHQEAIQCPEGFESVYLYSEDETPHVFKHQYVLFKNYQVLPTYIVDYVVDTYKEEQSKAPLCDNCTKVPPDLAKIYCVTENAYFCIQCEQEYHANRVSIKHKRVDIAEKPKKFGFCKKHDQNQLDLYCSTCSEALCMDCRILGNHMIDDMAKHSLIKLKDAYSEISSKVREIDPNIERRKNQLTDDLSKIDLKVKEINLKATYIEEQLRAIFEKALKELKTETQKKLSFLICDQLQLKRQFDHILWMDNFIKHQLEVQEPQDFLSSWYKYSKYKKQVLSLSNLSINTEVKADMKLEGQIKIVVESKSKKFDQTQINNAEKDILLNQLMHTPQKDPSKTFNEKELGSTNLRKAIFKKHYSDKFKEMGEEPPTIKGAMPNINSAQRDPQK